jgi:AAA15 family ATPase/GTPase
MIKSATFTNFTSVPSEKWKFFPGLNVIVGENGLGKSHALKSLYSILKTQSPGNLRVNGVQQEKLGKTSLKS